MEKQNQNQTNGSTIGYTQEHGSGHQWCSPFSVVNFLVSFIYWSYLTDSLTAT